MALSTTSSLSLNTSGDGDPTTSQSSPFQRLVKLEEIPPNIQLTKRLKFTKKPENTKTKQKDLTKPKTKQKTTFNRDVGKGKAALALFSNYITLRDSPACLSAPPQRDTLRDTAHSGQAPPRRAGGARLPRDRGRAIRRLLPAVQAADGRQRHRGPPRAPAAPPPPQPAVPVGREALGSAPGAQQHGEREHGHRPRQGSGRQRHRPRRDRTASTAPASASAPGPGRGAGPAV